MGKLIVVVGGQYGSEAKGRVAGELAAKEDNPFVIRVGGPNAGHTVWKDGVQWKFRQLPTAVVTNPNAQCAIGAGSEVDPILLAQEAAKVDRSFGDGYTQRRITVDPQATFLHSHFSDQEKELKDQIGSTGSGVGAARVARTWRKDGMLWKDWGSIQPWLSSDTAEIARYLLLEGGTVIVEGCQGYGLGQHAGHYPFCTSIDCRAIDMLAMAGISPWQPGVSSFQVWVVMRTRPIRVGGNSGPMYHESSWDELNLPEERTTVTNKVRRVGLWDPQLARRAIRANGTNVAVALTMLDHIYPDLEGCEDWAPEIEKIAHKFEQDLGGAKIWYVGTGKETAAWRPKK